VKSLEESTGARKNRCQLSAVEAGVGLCCVVLCYIRLQLKILRLQEALVDGSYRGRNCSTDNRFFRYDFHSLKI
jgi:hypothetical protein